MVYSGMIRVSNNFLKKPADNLGERVLFGSVKLTPTIPKRDLKNTTKFFHENRDIGLIAAELSCRIECLQRLPQLFSQFNTNNKFESFFICVRCRIA